MSTTRSGCQDDVFDDSRVARCRAEIKFDSCRSPTGSSFIDGRVEPYARLNYSNCFICIGSLHRGYVWRLLAYAGLPEIEIVMASLSQSERERCYLWLADSRVCPLLVSVVCTYVKLACREGERLVHSIAPCLRRALKQS